MSAEEPREFSEVQAVDDLLDEIVRQVDERLSAVLWKCQPQHAAAG